MKEKTYVKKLEWQPLCVSVEARVLRQGRDNTLAKTDEEEGIQVGWNYGEHSV